MTTTDPTPLAEQIAREHAPHIEWEAAGLGIAWRGCSCGERVSRTDHRAHIATVTEQAVVDRLEAFARELDALTITHQAENYATVLRIKREGVIEAIRRVRERR